MGVVSGKQAVRGLDTPKAYSTIFGLGVVAFLACGWIIYRSVFGATAFTQPKNANRNTNVGLALSTEIQKLKTVDTDGDGLSDYDELYNLHTSPYLKDSDGDGLSDSAEIQSGTDPNCPKGKACEGFRPLTSITDSTGNLTPQFLRQALAAAGVPQATLDSASDATLLQIYNQAIVKNGTTTNGNANTSTTNSPTTENALDTIQNLTSDEIRQLLIKNGVDATSLTTIDDTTLRQIFQEAVSTSADSANTNSTP